MAASPLHIARFELRRMLRDPYTWCGLLAFMLVAGAGAYFYWQSLPPRPTGSRLFNDGYMLALVFAFHCGLARDRQCRFDRYMVANFASAPGFYFGHLLATVAFLGLLYAFALAYGTVLALGDVGFALEHASRFFYYSLLMLPFVVVLELLLSTRLPVPVLLITFVLAGLLYSRIGELNKLFHLLGMDSEVPLIGALVRAALALLVAAAMYPLFRKRLGRVSLASD